MEVVSGFLALAVAVLSLGLLTNIYREHRHYQIHLKPNCLLTRHSVVFVTGKRSLFYFRKYWNAYPEILAEHGYEVFTLHLPWRGPQRRARFEKFLQQQNKQLHFICDSPTFVEFKDLFANHSNVKSVLPFKYDGVAPTEHQTQSWTLNLAFRLHTLHFQESERVSGKDLGVDFPQGAAALLHHMQEMGEQDFLS
jgi:hypothetical protein